MSDPLVQLMYIHSSALFCVGVGIYQSRDYKRVLYNVCKLLVTSVGWVIARLFIYHLPSPACGILCV